MGSEPAPATARPDGRATRWDEHRRARRSELVEATLRAIRHHGAEVGMDDIATEAQTSKTVLYRHFGDKAGLYRAVVESVERLIVGDLATALDPTGDGPTSPDDAVRAAVDAYLTLVEKDPAVYRFVVGHPLLDRPMSDDPVTGLTARVGAQLTGVLAQVLADSGHPATGADTLAHGVVGMVRAAADHWLTTPDPVPRQLLSAQVSTLLRAGLTGLGAATHTDEHPRQEGP